MNLDQPEELTEQMRLSDSLINSEVNLDQQMQLTEEEEHQDGILMIGGIEVFLPSAQEEAENSVVDGATAEQSQLEMTVRKERKLEQVGETAQAQLGAEEEDGEHSEEWLSIFSQEAENTARRELATTDEEDTNNICFVDLWGHIEALEEKVKVQGMHIQQAKLEPNEGGMGDHDDLPNGQNFLQMRRLHEQDQPWEQLDKVIMEIMQLMLKSAQTASKEQLGRKKEAAAAAM
jgi:hypothetical protein